MPDVTATHITVQRSARLVTLKWTDGHTSNYPFSLLRRACPCVTCRGGHEHMRSEPDPQVFDQPDVISDETTLRKLEPVGTYALTAEWEDNHHYGIYTWSYLRKLCPCDACRQGKADA